MLLRLRFSFATDATNVSAGLIGVPEESQFIEAFVIHVDIALLSATPLSFLAFLAMHCVELVCFALCRVGAKYCGPEGFSGLYAYST